uniref:Cysteine-rich motor neuron 1 protein n=1 Tax=Lygus hesperus TaxID=30085 RepID=A0A0A9W8R8_LYGHE
MACVKLQCPKDSVQSANGDCVCNPNCPVQDCPPGYDIKITRRGSGLPGDCCNEYNCQKSGTFCPQDSKPTPSGTCECAPERCLPFPDCGPDMTPVIVTNALNYPGACCAEYNCVQKLVDCPQDSYVDNGVCVCYPCASPVCPGGSKVKKHALHTPGDCCDMIDCTGFNVICGQGEVLSPDGTVCVCDENQCPTPFCDPGSKLVTVRVAGHVPGDCCDKHSCMSLQCPPGTILKGDGCECIPNACMQPQCDSGVLETTKKATGTPPDCCDEFICRLVIPPGCPTDSVRMPDGSCVCAPDSCQNANCPPGYMVVVDVPGNNVPGSCCPKTSCIPEQLACPSDSYRQDALCVCFPCAEPSCQPGTTLQILSKGTNEPSNCCDTTFCATIQPNCQYGTIFKDGQCVCDVASCSTPVCNEGFTLLIVKEAVGVPPDCCPDYLCTKMDCPEDSMISPDGKCICTPSYCQSNVCPPGTMLVVVQQGSNEPGHCCDKISCEPFNPPPIICPPYSIAMPDGSCRCMPDQCQQPACPADTRPSVYREPSNIPPDCCPDWTCMKLIECPSDSVLQGDKCVCYPCVPALPCPFGQTQVTITSGNNTPGSCCDLFGCGPNQLNCPPGSMVSPDGKICLCQPQSCPRPVCEKGFVETVTSYATNVFPQCCNEYVCTEFKCTSPDSMPDGNGNCVCIPNICAILHVLLGPKPKL